MLSASDCVRGNKYKRIMTTTTSAAAAAAATRGGGLQCAQLKIVILGIFSTVKIHRPTNNYMPT